MCLMPSCKQKTAPTWGNKRQVRILNEPPAAMRHATADDSVFGMSPFLRFSWGEFYCILYGLVRTEVVKTIHISDGPILLLATQHRTNHGWWAEVQTGYGSPFAMLSTLIIC